MITGAFLVPSPAMAQMEEGPATYTRFLEGVSAHDIERVRVAADGRTAEFLTSEGARGAVNLFNDPNLFKMLQENKVDLSVMPPDQAGAALFGVLNTLAFPLILFGGIFLLNR
jgi:ATP-dependent Zn protease